MKFRSLARFAKTVFLAAAVFAVSGCAWIQTHQSQIDSTLEIVGSRVANVAFQTLVNSAVDEADAGFKANYLDTIASGLRSQETTIVSSDDIAKIIQVWSPNDGAAWQTVAANVATVADQALAANGKTQAAAVVEQVASGLNTAAGKLRTATPTPVNNTPGATVKGNPLETDNAVLSVHPIDLSQAAAYLKATGTNDQ